MKIYSIVINNIDENKVSLHEKSFSSHEEAAKMIPEIAKETVTDMNENCGEDNFDYDADLGSIVDNFGNVVIDFVVDYTEIGHIKKETSMKKAEKVKITGIVWTPVNEDELPRKIVLDMDEIPEYDVNVKTFGDIVEDLLTERFGKKYGLRASRFNYREV